MRDYLPSLFVLLCVQLFPNSLYRLPFLLVFLSDCQLDGLPFWQSTNFISIIGCVWINLLSRLWHEQSTHSYLRIRELADKTETAVVTVCISKEHRFCSHGRADIVVAMTHLGALIPVNYLTM